MNFLFFKFIGMLLIFIVYFFVFLLIFNMFWFTIFKFLSSVFILYLGKHCSLLDFLIFLQWLQSQLILSPFFRFLNVSGFAFIIFLFLSYIHSLLHILLWFAEISLHGLLFNAFKMSLFLMFLKIKIFT